MSQILQTIGAAEFQNDFIAISALKQRRAAGAAGRLSPTRRRRRLCRQEKSKKAR
jgi:hypothetical protein